MEIVTERYNELKYKLNQKEIRYFSSSGNETKELSLQISYLKSLIALHESILGLNDEN